MIKLKLKANVHGIAWTRFRERLRLNLVGAQEMGRTRFLIGSTLPYASHWIEEGWRVDPRQGRIEIKYRQPSGAYFMQDLGAIFSIGRRRRGKGVGATFSGAIMADYAKDIVIGMRDRLNKAVYDHPPPRNRGHNYSRSHRLFNSIKAYRA